MTLYLFAARAIASLHLLWVLFVVIGAFVCWRHRVWKWIHLGAIVYGLGIEIWTWTCPLTTLEKHFMARAGLKSYSEDFTTHLLSTVLYPGVPKWILVAGAAIVLTATL